MQQEGNVRYVPNSIAVAGSDTGRDGSALESIHRRFVNLHRPPIVTLPQRPAADAAAIAAFPVVAAAAGPTEEEVTRPISTSGTRRGSAPQTLSMIEKRVLLDSLKRKRMAMVAALEERRCLRAPTTLLHDLSAQRSRQNELVRRPYLRYLSGSFWDANPRDRGSATFFRPGRPDRQLRRHRRAVDFFNDSILMNDPVTQHDERYEPEESTIGQGIDSLSSTLRDPPTLRRTGPAIAPALHPTGPAAAAATAGAETDVATERSAARLLRMASSSYLLLAGISVSLEDEGRVLALQFDPRSFAGHTAAANDKGSGSDDYDDAAADDGEPAPICCAFLQFATAVTKNNGSGPSTTSNDRPVYYLRLQSHTFPTPLVPRLNDILGQVRLGPMTGSSRNAADGDGHDEEASDDDKEEDSLGEEGVRDAFLKDFGRRCRDVHRHLLAYHARQRFVGQLRAMDKRSQKRTARRRARQQQQQPLVDDAVVARGQGLASANNNNDAASQKEQRQLSRGMDDGELEDVMSDNSVNGDERFGDTDDDDDGDDDRTEMTAVAEEVTVSTVPYHYVNVIVLNDQQIKFRLSCTFASSSDAPQPPRLVVNVMWPEQQTQPSPRGVSIAYTQSRSNRIRVSDAVRAFAERERQRREALRHRRRHDSPIDPALDPEEDVATSAAMAISSDEDEEHDDSARRFGSAPAVGNDPYLTALQEEAGNAFANLPLRSALDRLVSKMKQLVEEYDESA